MGRYSTTILDTFATVRGQSSRGNVVRIDATRGLGVPAGVRTLWLRLCGVLSASLQAAPAAGKQSAAGCTAAMYRHEAMHRLYTRSRREVAPGCGVRSGF